MKILVMLLCLTVTGCAMTPQQLGAFSDNLHDGLQTAQTDWSHTPASGQGNVIPMPVTCHSQDLGGGATRTVCN